MHKRYDIETIVSEIANLGPT